MIESQIRTKNNRITEGKKKIADNVNKEKGS